MQAVARVPHRLAADAERRIEAEPPTGNFGDVEAAISEEGLERRARGECP